MTVKEAIRLVTIDEDGKKKLNVADVSEVFRRQKDRCRLDPEFRYAMLSVVYAPRVSDVINEVIDDATRGVKWVPIEKVKRRLSKRRSLKLKRIRLPKARRGKRK